jgi:repressor LexA
MRDLTPTQRTVLSAIGRALDAGPAPTVRELADQLRMKRSTVHYHILALRRAGYITGEGRHRDITLTSAAREISGKSGGKTPEPIAPEADGALIPIVGSVAAGQPILAAEHLTGSLSLGGLFDRKGTLFALQVAGDSMIGDGIFEGDYAIVRQQASASPGDVVVAMIEDGDASEATIKRYREDRGAVVLEPSNPSYEPLRFAGHSRDRLRILGKLVGVLRKI